MTGTILAAIAVGLVIRGWLEWREHRWAKAATQGFRSQTGAEWLVGAEGEVESGFEDGADSGRVRIVSESWSAKCSEAGAALRSGDEIVVESVEGLTLHVRRMR